MTFNEWKSSLVEGKNPCYWCRKDNRDKTGENFHYYGEGEGGHCFSAHCGKTLLSEEYKEEYGINEVELEEFEFVATEFNENVHNKLKEQTGLDSKGYRGIRTDISKSLGVRYEYNTEDGSVAKTYYPVTKGCLEKDIKDSIVGYKIRSHPKSFLPPVGEADNSCDLFMQWKFKSHRGMLAICCGEVDAMSAYQMLYDAHVKSGNKEKYDEIAVVAGITGEGGMAAQLRNHYEWLSQFSKIIIIPDNDKAGKIAEEKVAAVLPRGKAFTVNLRLKDVNEYLAKGMEREFISDFWGNKPYTPDGIKSSVDGFGEIEEELLRPRIKLPQYMHRLEHNLGGGFQQGRIVNVIAGTGAGKTTHVRELIKHWIFHTELKPTIVSLEETAAQYSLGLLQSYLKENFVWGRQGQDIVDMLRGEKYVKAMKELKYTEEGAPRYFIIDERSGSIGNIEDKMEEMHKKYGSKLFVIDVLSDLLRGRNADLAEDHMNFQREFVKEGVTIVNVMHTVKIPLGQDGRPRQVTEYDALGTGSFVQSAAYNIVLNRDKMEDNKIMQNTTEVGLPKGRGSKTGIAGYWYFDFDTQTCYDLEDYKENNPHMFVGED